MVRVAPFFDSRCINIYYPLPVVDSLLHNAGEEGGEGEEQLENVAIANALQLEAARRRAVPIRFNSSPVPSLK